MCPFVLWCAAPVRTRPRRGVEWARSAEKPNFWREEQRSEAEEAGSRVAKRHGLQKDRMVARRSCLERSTGGARQVSRAGVARQVQSSAFRPHRFADLRTQGCIFRFMSSTGNDFWAKGSRELVEDAEKRGTKAVLLVEQVSSVSDIPSVTSLGCPQAG